MCGIQNVIRKDGIYYYRRLIRIGSDTPFRLRLSLKTASRRQAALMAPALTIHCAHLVMRLMEKANQDGLTEQQRAEIFRQQILIERDRLEVMHAKLHIIPPEEQDDIEQALALRLGASEAVDALRERMHKPDAIDPGAPPPAASAPSPDHHAQTSNRAADDDVILGDGFVATLPTEAPSSAQDLFHPFRPAPLSAGHWPRA